MPASDAGEEEIGDEASDTHATTACPANRLITLYPALRNGCPGHRVMEIRGDLGEHGVPMPRVVGRVQHECGAIGAGRLRRLATAVREDVTR